MKRLENIFINSNDDLEDPDIRNGILEDLVTSV